jgi:hypothetical protein
LGLGSWDLERTDEDGFTTELPCSERKVASCLMGLAAVGKFKRF